MKREDKNKISLTGAQRVKQYRQVRRKAGLVEVRTWVKESDFKKVQGLLLPFRQDADGVLQVIEINKYPEHELLEN